jgi:hypothetical protein
MRGFTGRADSYVLTASYTIRSGGDGDGSPASPLQIGTGAQLLEFKSLVDGGETNLYAVLTADIDLTSGEYASHQWAPIGSATAQYTGIFNGDGHIIKLAASPTGNPSYLAFFHTIGMMGMVKNLTLEVNFSGGAYMAGVALYNYGTIAYVTVKGSITASSNYVGGIVRTNDKVQVGRTQLFQELAEVITRKSMSRKSMSLTILSTYTTLKELVGDCFRRLNQTARTATAPTE